MGQELYPAANQTLPKTTNVTVASLCTTDNRERAQFDVIGAFSLAFSYLTSFATQQLTMTFDTLVPKIQSPEEVPQHSSSITHSYAETDIHS